MFLGAGRGGRSWARNNAEMSKRDRRQASVARGHCARPTLGRDALERRPCRRGKDSKYQSQFYFPMRGCQRILGSMEKGPRRRDRELNHTYFLSLLLGKQQNEIHHLPETVEESRTLLFIRRNDY